MRCKFRNLNRVSIHSRAWRLTDISPQAVSQWDGFNPQPRVAADDYYGELYLSHQRFNPQPRVAADLG